MPTLNEDTRFLTSQGADVALADLAAELVAEINELVPQAAPVDQSHDAVVAGVTVPAAITGGESPTEAEHNTLRAAVQALEDAHDALVTEHNLLRAEHLELVTKLTTAGLLT